MYLLFYYFDEPKWRQVKKLSEEVLDDFDIGMVEILMLSGDGKFLKLVDFGTNDWEEVPEGEKD